MCVCVCVRAHVCVSIYTKLRKKKKNKKKKKEGETDSPDNELKRNPLHSRQDKFFLFFFDKIYHIIDLETHEIDFI